MVELSAEKGHRSAIPRRAAARAHGQATRFENVVSQDREALARWTKDSGNWAGPVSRGRVGAQQLMTAVARLRSEQRRTDVHCHLLHGGKVVLDQPLPWEVVAAGTSRLVVTYPRTSISYST